MTKRLLLLIAIIVIHSNLLLGQALQLIQDLNLEKIKNFPYRITRSGSALNNLYIYAFDDGVHGLEVWVSDGSPEGTRLIKDIAPGFQDSNPNGFTVHGGFVYFAADDLIHGSELWRTDGTAQNTTLVKDFQIGLATGSPGSFFSFGNKMLLTANDGTGFKTMVLESSGINVIGPSSIIYFDFIGNILPIGDVLYFCGSNAAGTKLALWRTDATAAGTYVVKEFSESSLPVHFNVLNGSLYFMLTNQANGGMELWKSDGTEAGTNFFHDLELGFQYYEGRQVTKYNNHIYFGGYGGFWKTDGTESGTTFQQFDQLVGSARVDRLFSFKNDLYFLAGDKLVKGNGTFEGSTIVENVNIQPYEFSCVVLNDNIIYTKKTAEHGNELWRNDGTNSQLIKDIRVGPQTSDIISLTASTEKAFFFANDGENAYATWSTDGTEAGTKLVNKIGAETTFSSNPGNFEVIGDRLMFTAEDSNDGSEPYLMDLNGNIQLVSSVESQPKIFTASLNYEGYFYNRNQPNGFFIGDDYCFFGSEGSSSRGLYKLLPTGAYQKVADVGQSVHIVKFIKIPGQEKFYFLGQDETHGRELWITDGTPSGTHMVKDITPGQSFAFLNNWSWEISSEGILYFSMGDDDNTGLWRSDGTEAGTFQLKDTNPAGRDDIYAMKLFNNQLYFTAASETGNIELWRSNGTEAGTTLFVEINPGNVDGYKSSYPGEFTIFQNQLFFVAYHPAYGRELWVTDGTQAGTKLVKDINPGPLSSLGGFPYFTSYNDQLYFAANDGTHGLELWRTDGTTEGTTILKDLAPGSLGSDPRELIVRKNAILFYASDGSSKSCLWASKGDPALTFKIHLDEEVGEIHPWMSVQFNDKIYIGAQGHGVGMELYSLNQLKFSQTINLPEIGIKTYGDAATTITANATSGLPVTLISNNTSVAKIENNQLIVVGAGETTIIATQSGNEDFAAVETSRLVVVDKKPQQLTFTEVGEKTFGNTPFALSASASSSLPVTFSSSSSDILAIEGTNATIKGAGSVEITASQTGNSNYLPAESIKRTLIINKAQQSITFEPLEDKKEDDKPFDLVASASSGLEVLFVSSNPGVASVVGKNVTIHDSGETILTASQSGNGNYFAAESVARTLNVLLITGVETVEVGVYPNPVQNELIIRVSSPSAANSIKTFDNQGKVVALTHEKLDEHTISVDFSTTLPGIYLVKVGRQTLKISKR